MITHLKCWRWLKRLVVIATIVVCLGATDSLSEEPMWSVYLDRSYYTTESKAFVICYFDAQTIRYRPGAFDPENDRFPDIQVSLHHNPDGGFVLLAANSHYYPVDVIYQISILTDRGRVKRLFDPAEFEVHANSFRDEVEFLGTRAYVFRGEAVSDRAVEITVTMTPHPDQIDPVYSAPRLPDTGRPGKTNLLCNPGFEEATLPGWPDYYLSTTAGPRSGPPGSQSGYGLDRENPFEGKAALWVRVNNEKAQRVYEACSPKLKEKTSFVLSAYMRADRDHVRVRFAGFGWKVPRPTFGHKEFTLTTQWQRYSEKETLPAGLPPWHSVGVEILAGQNATVFVDAFQLERGSEPTAYEP